MKILVVEDNIVAAHFLRKTLERLKHRVEIASNGVEAWRLLQDYSYDIVISDWVMPEMDGPELCRRVRDREREAHTYTYVILLSAKDQRQDRLEGLQSGADDFLVKPLDHDELAARLEVARRILDTQAKLAQTIGSLEIANARFTELYMGLPIACIVYGAEGQIEDWNRASSVLFGVGADSLDWSPFWAAISNSAHPGGRLDTMRAVLSGGKFSDVEWVYPHGDGTPHHVLCSMFPMVGRDGAIFGAIGTHIDITKRKEDERRIREASILLEQQKRELERANAKLEDLATSDGLTGLKNHRAFQERLASEIQRGSRYYIPLSLMMLDVDHFKQYNDQFGHPTGDQVLKQVAAILQANARVTDFVARYGGEEFVILLPETGSDSAAQVAERIRASVAEYPWELRQITVSIGVTSTHSDIVSSMDLVEAADKALYMSKSGGRNRVTQAEPPSTEL